MKKLIKILAWIILIPLLLLVLAGIAIQFESVQNFIVDKLTASLSRQLNTEVDIGQVYIKFFKTIHIEDLYIEDQNRDTLLALDELSASIGLFSLFKQTIYLDQIRSKGLRSKIYNTPSDSSFNFQFIIDNFAPDTTATSTESSGAVWNIGLGSAAITNTYISYLDSVNQLYLQTRLPQLSLEVEEFDLAKRLFKVNELLFSRPDFEMHTISSSDTALATDSLHLVFPYTGWDLALSNADIEEGHFRYWVDNLELKENSFDFNHLDFRELHLDLGQLKWDSTALALNLEQLQLVDQSNLRITEAHAQITLTPEDIFVQDLLILSPSSRIENSTTMSFDSWNALPDFMNRVFYESSFQNTRLALEDLELFVPYIPEGYRIDKPLFISGTITGQEGRVAFQQLDFEIGNILNFQSTGVLSNVMDPEALKMDLSISELSVDYRQLRNTLPVLNLPAMADSLGRITLSGKFNGSMDSVRIGNFLLNTSANTFLKASGKVRNLADVNALSFELNIDTLQTRAEDLAYFSTNPLPQGIYEMKNISYSGLISGNRTDFRTKGNLHTHIGALQTDLQINFNESYTNADYVGNLQLKGFDLGRFLGDTTLYGKATLEATVDGLGITPDSLDTRIDATINAITYNGYSYENIKVDGEIDRMRFLGMASMADPNLAFNFKGLVDLNGETPVFQFDAALDTIDLAALGFSPQIIRASATISSNLTGNNIDDFLGQAIIKDLYLSNDTLTFHSDSLVAKAVEAGSNNKQLVINSDHLTALFEGDFALSTLPRLMQNYVNDYFPLDHFISPIDQPDSLAIEPFPQSDTPDQKIQFYLKIVDATDITRLFTPVLERLDSAIAEGQFNSRDKSLNIGMRAPVIVASGWELDSLNWTIAGDASMVNSNLRLPQISNGALEFKNNLVSSTISNDSLTTDLYVYDRRASSILEWGFELMPSNDQFKLKLRDSLIIDEQTWLVNDDHQILFGDSLLHVNDFLIRKGGQYLAIQSYNRMADQDFTPIELNFTDFQLSEFSALTGLEDFNYRGLINGTITLNDVVNDLHYLADLSLNDVYVNDTLIGQIDIIAEQNPSQPVVNIRTSLSGNGNQMLAEGTYNIASSYFDVKADIEQFPLILVDPFTLGSIKRSSGYAAGEFIIQGTPDQPTVNGTLSLRDAATTIVYLNTRYRLENGQIRINNKLIDLGTMQLVDANENIATLSGNIRHDFFQNFWFDLQFDTDKFRFLNTQAGDNELFYGTLNLSAQIDVAGTLDLPQIGINARTLSDSRLVVSAIVNQDYIRQEDYIIFGKPGEISLDSVLAEQARSRGYSTPEINMLLNLELTPEAELVVVIDPSTGDQLTARGNASLTVEMPPTGEINITGLYTAVSGSYNFNYQGLVKRSFSLQPGSQLTFIGDPLDTRFDVTASYTTRTGIYSLIANESSLSDAAIRQAKERNDVKVLLRMEGDLNNPELSFDIQVPELINSSLSTTINRKLGQLREDEAELNKQVFGLLLLNSFVAEQSATAGLSTAGENIALSSVSNLISNQLNRLSDQYLKGVGLTFDLESYRGQFDEAGNTSTRTNLNVGVTQSIFNDRLTIKVGGVVQVDNNANPATASGLSNIAGDFVLEYQLTKSGNYILKVFQRSDYDAFDDSNISKTGVGISYKKSFGK